MTVAPEAPAAQEIYDSPAEETVFRYLDGVGNHELKTLLSSILMSEPDRMFTGTDMTRELNHRQGDVPVWKQGPTAALQYSRSSLEPVGAVIKNRALGARGTVVDAWQAEREGRNLRLALSGFLSDWSLSWPDISVQEAFGATASSSERRQPRIRYEIYQALLTGSEGDTIENVRRAIGEGVYEQDEGFTGQIRKMHDRGLLTLETKHHNYDPTLEVLYMEPSSHVVSKLPDASPETKALYGALAELKQGVHLTANQLVSLAQSKDPTISSVKLRQSLVGGVSKGDRYPSLKFTDTREMGMSEQSRVVFKTGVTEPIGQLVEGIQAIQDGIGWEVHSARANEIISTPSLFAALTEKAHNFSSYASTHMGKEQDGIDDTLQAIIHTLGGVTVAEARQAVNEQLGRTVTRHYIAHRLRELALQGTVSIEAVSAGPHIKRMLNRYVKPQQ